MKKVVQPNNYFRVSAGVLAVAIATASVSLPTLANAEAGQPAKIAQGSLIGQCRAVNKKVSVYKQASATGAVVRNLDAEARVTLSDNGSGGFIGISSPVSGYVQVANLKPCPGNPTTPVGNTCRRVIQSQGLKIRREPSETAAIVGGVDYQERVFLTTTPATSRNAGGRSWIQIARPTAGWVSNGALGSGSSNLAVCP